MSLHQALRAAHRAGISFQARGGRLVLTAAASPDPEIVASLRQHKAEIMALMAPLQEAWHPTDWLAYFDERAGIAEYDGGLSRTDAEAQAFEACVAECVEQSQGRGAMGEGDQEGRSKEAARIKAAAALRRMGIGYAQPSSELSRATSLAT